MSKIYIMGSLRNPRIPAYANLIEARGHEVFADWHSPGPEADEYWQRYETERGRTFIQAINGPHAWNVYHFDKKWLDWCDTGIMICPSGKSAFGELCYLAGKEKRRFILLDGEPERWDVMFRFANGIYDNLPALLEVL